MAPLRNLLLLTTLAVVGCGGGDETASKDDPPTDPNIAGPGQEYVEPLIAPIDLGGSPVAAIRSAEGGHLVDPLGLPVERQLVNAADFTADERASFHAHGEEICASGCAASRHPTPDLTEAEFRKLMVEFSRGTLDETNPALESLCFYGRQTEAWMDRLGPNPLSDERAAFLRRELKRTHALISFRIVDEHGVIRTHMPPTRVPFDRRHVFHMETENLPPLETSGTVKRVGLHHLWTRL